jgi:hypothetical protein
MSVRLPTYAAISLVLVLLSASACNRGSASVTSPATTTNLKAALAVEPAVLRPEILNDVTCPAAAAFGIRLNVIVGGDDLIIRGVRFIFSDRLGRRLIPEAFSSGAGSTSIPSSAPIPFPNGSALPGSAPITIPGFPVFNGTRVIPGARLTQPFFLRFGCDVLPEGTIIVTVDHVDASGRPGLSDIQVGVR